MSTENELKPCPAGHNEGTNTYSVGSLNWIECNKCGWRTGTYITVELAEKSWNTRSDTVSVLEGAREKLWSTFRTAIPAAAYELLDTAIQNAKGEKGWDR